MVRIALYTLELVDSVIRGVCLGRKTKLDLVLCETTRHALAGLIIAKMLRVRCVWDSHGSGLLYARSVGKGRLYTWAVSTVERLLGRGVDRLITVSEPDTVAYAQIGIPREKIHSFPTCVDLQGVVGRVESRMRKREARILEPDRERVMIFFGNFKYEPNRRALLFINDTLAPAVAEAGHRFKIRVAGRDIPNIRYHPAIEIVGFVPDLYEQIADADIGIVPVWSGVGILVKALDIMAVGIPLVASKFVTSGIPELRNRIHALLADEPETFPQAVMQALHDLNNLKVMALRARQLVAQRYDWKTRWAIFEELLIGTSATSLSKDGLA